MEIKMKKIWTIIILILISTTIHATKEVKTKIIYDVDNNRLLAIITYGKNKEKNQKCEEYVRGEDGLKILKILSKGKQGRVILGFICNSEITEKR